MSSLKSTGLEPPTLPLTAAPRAGTAAYDAEKPGVARKPGPVDPSPPSKELWLQMVDAFRLQPENFFHCAGLTGVTPAYAMLAWRNGWWREEGCEFMIPISNVLESERITARAAIARMPGKAVSPETVAVAKTEAASAVQAAIMDMAEIRTGEARLVRTARALTLGSLAAISPLKKVIHDLSKKAAEGLAKANLPPKEALKIIRSIEEIARCINEQAKIAIELEHKLLGEPDIRVEHTGSVGTYATLDDALREINSAHEAAKRVSADRDELLMVLDASAVETTSPQGAQEAEEPDPEDEDEDESEEVEEEPDPPPPPPRKIGPKKPLGPPPPPPVVEETDDDYEDEDEDDLDDELDDNGLGSNILGDDEDEDEDHEAEELEEPEPPRGSRIARAMGRRGIDDRDSAPTPAPRRAAAPATRKPASAPRPEASSVLFAKRRV